MLGEIILAYTYYKILETNNNELEIYIVINEEQGRKLLLYLAYD